MSAFAYEMSDSLTQNLIEKTKLVEEFPTLRDIVYVDHAATTLVSRSQLDKNREDILNNLYGNPHSRSPSSQLTSDTIDQIRYRILKFFNTTFEKYTVIFTAGCTASLKLLGESFDFQGSFSQDFEDTGLKETEKHDEYLQKRSSLSEKEKDPDNFNRASSVLNKINCGVDIVNQYKQTERKRTNSEKLIENIEIANKETERKRTDSEKLIENIEIDNSNNSISSDQSQDAIQSRKVRSSNGSFTYLLDNHTSVQGMRELAFQSAGKVQCIDCDQHFNFNPSVSILKQDPCFTGRGNHLFVYPAQSNFNGTKYPSEWVAKVQNRSFQWQKEDEFREDLDRPQREHDTSRWLVCLDAASLVSTSGLDLDVVKPDFVTLSFYKMFGFPTGLGALIVRNSATNTLKKTYFGGGTVSVSLSCKPYHVSWSSLSERFEDGTLPFLDIIALKHGFDVITSLDGGMTRISNHTFNLAKFFYNALSSLTHGNGSPVAVLYSVGQYTNIQTQGGIVNFNLLRSSGEYVGFAEVDKLAQLFQIHLRTGCFCNMGACQKFLNLTDEEIKNNYKSGHVCGDNKDLIDGKPTGSVRISFGYMSTIEDAQKCLQFIVDCFLESTQKPVFWMSKKKEIESADTSMCHSSSCTTKTEKNEGPDAHLFKLSSKNGLSKGKENSEDSEFLVCQHKQLKEICLYPVKSCGAFKVEEWRVGPRGLLFDREWMIVTESGIAMSQKREKNLSLIKPSIDLDEESLTLHYPDMESVTISMKYTEEAQMNSYMCNSKVCGDRVQSLDCGQAVADWLSEALQRPGCRLLRQKPTDGRKSKLPIHGDTVQEKSQLSLANECQYLLINEESVCVLQKKIFQQYNEHFNLDNLEARFRANLIVSGCKPFEEDKWLDVQIGVIRFKSQGACTRCQMVCLDQQTGERNKSPLQVLSTWKDRKTSFGVLLCSNVNEDTPAQLSTIKVGDPVLV